MAQPVAPAPAQPRYVGAWPVSRVFLLIGAICLIIAAVCAAGIFTGPVSAWVIGAAACWFLAWAF
jgi:hypothetical protein